MEQLKSVLIIGSTGSIGRNVVNEAVKQGFSVRALVRNVNRAHFDGRVELIQGDLTQPLALDPVDAVIFTQGSYNSQMAEFVDYHGVRNILTALKGKLKRIALMTSIYATTDRENSKWKRRAERLVRASGIPYTIIRPSWFDTNKTDEQMLSLTQNDQNHTYTFSAQDGGVSRYQIAETLVRSLNTENASNRTVALLAVKGKPTTDFETLFKETLADIKKQNFDGIHDPANLPFEKEPEPVLQDLISIKNN